MKSTKSNMFTSGSKLKTKTGPYSRPGGKSSSSKELPHKNLTEVLSIYSQEELDSVFEDKLKKEHEKVDNTKKSIFVKRLVHYWSKERAAPFKGSDSIQDNIKICVSKLSQNISRLNEKFTTETEGIKLVGSVAEGAKILAPDEFDFLYVINTVPSCDLNIDQIYPDTFKPRSKDENPPALYFKLSVEQVPEMWKTGSKTSPVGMEKVNIRGQKKYYLKARAIQEDFQATIARVYDKLGVKDPVISCNGPAVTLHIKLSKEDLLSLESKNQQEGHIKNPEDIKKKTLENIRRLVAKVDLSIAIPILKETLAKCMKENDLANLPGEETFYFVPSGDYWKLSCCHLETEKMKTLLKNEQKVQCFQALKVFI